MKLFIIDRVYDEFGYEETHQAVFTHGIFDSKEKALEGLKRLTAKLTKDLEGRKGASVKYDDAHEMVYYDPGYDDGDDSYWRDYDLGGRIAIYETEMNELNEEGPE